MTGPYPIPNFRRDEPLIRREVNRRTFGKKRTLGCECTYQFTCRPCCVEAALRNYAERLDRI